MADSKSKTFGPKNEVEHAYYSGMIIQRVRGFVNDEEAMELINWGSSSRAKPVDPKSVRIKGDTGTNGLFIAFKPTNIELYEKLLPPHLSVPVIPVVSLVTVDYNTGNSVTRYNEGMVMIKGVCSDGTETWFVLSMPVETWLMMEMGVDWGFPKRLFDITVKNEKTLVLDKGITHLALEMTQNSPSDESDILIPSGDAWGINNMAVIHPIKKDILLIFSYGPISVQERIFSKIGVSVDQTQPWAGLIPEGLISNGVFQRYISVGDSAIRKKFQNQ